MKKIRVYKYGYKSIYVRKPIAGGVYDVDEIGADVAQEIVKWGAGEFVDESAPIIGNDKGLSLEELESKSRDELLELAEDLAIQGVKSNMRKSELFDLVKSRLGL